MTGIKCEDFLSSPSTVGRPSPTSSNLQSPGQRSSASHSLAPSKSSTSPYQTPPSSRTSVSDVFGRHAQMDAEPGELWLSAKKMEDPWPVVVCDEEMLQTLMKGKDRPANAPQENGIWRKEFRPGGDLAGQRCFPTICWTPWKRLKPIDILLAKSTKDSTDNPALADAYEEAIEQYGRNDLTYWKDKIYAQRLSAKAATKRLGVKKEENETPKKRKIGQGGFKYPPSVVGGIRVFGDEDLFVSDEESTAKKVKVEDNDHTLSIKSPAQAELPFSQTPKPGSRSRGTRRPSTPLSVYSQSDKLNSSPLVAVAPKQYSVDESSADSSMKVYVGDPPKVFKLSRKGLLDISGPNSKMWRTYSAERSLKSRLLSGIDPDDFGPVAEYINGKDALRGLTAKLSEKGAVETSVAVCDSFRHYAMTHLVAKKLGIGHLSKSSLQELRSLSLEPTAGFLRTTEHLVRKGAVGDKSLHRFLARHLADWFCDLMQLDAKMFCTIMAIDSGFAGSVLEELALVLKESGGHQT